MMRIIDIAFHGMDRFEPEVMDRTMRAERTLVAPSSAQAVDVVQQATESGARLILVVDEEREPRGLVVPASLPDQLAQARGHSVDDVAEALRQMEQDPDEIARGFHHEPLNEVIPVLFICQPYGHVVDRCPCAEPDHEDGSCDPYP